jgi:hypothetical protein
MGMAFTSMGRHYGGYTRGWVREVGVFGLIVLYLAHGTGWQEFKYRHGYDIRTEVYPTGCERPSPSARIFGLR